MRNKISFDKNFRRPVDEKDGQVYEASPVAALCVALQPAEHLAHKDFRSTLKPTSKQGVDSISSKNNSEHSRKVSTGYSLRQLSPPTPKKFLNDKENVTRNHQSKIDSVRASGKPGNAKTSSRPVKKVSTSKSENQVKKVSSKSENQSKLTDFFAVRRSERRPKVECEAEQQKLIEERLMLDHDQDLGLDVRHIPEKGRGIFTTREISKGEFVVEYSGDLIDLKKAKEREADYSMDLSKGCYMYYFKANNRQYCIDATKETDRLGRLVNHSRIVANLRTKVIMFKGTPRLILVAARDVHVGEELLYDYGDRSKESLAAHPWLAL